MILLATVDAIDDRDELAPSAVDVRRLLESSASHPMIDVQEIPGIEFASAPARTSARTSATRPTTSPTSQPREQRDADA